MNYKSVKVYFKILVLMLCAIIGVGFVSGAEIYQFFVRFGRFSYLGVLIFFLVLFYLVIKILNDNNQAEKVYKMNILENNTKNYTFSLKFKIKSKLIFFNGLMMASAMFAGLFNIINNLFFNNYYLLACFAILIIFLILLFGISGLEKFDYVVIVFFVIISIFLILNINKSNIAIEFDYDFTDNCNNLLLALVSSVVYIFINIIQIQPILIENKLNFNAKQKKLFAFIFSAIMTIILLIFIKFFNHNLYLKNSEMPFLKYFKNRGGAIYIIFLMGLLLSLLSSLLTAMIGVKKVFRNKISSNLFATFATMGLVLIFSFIGFSNFISIVYPIIGIINFIIYVFL